MILDELAAKTQASVLRQWCRTAQIVQVPFPIYVDRIEGNWLALRDFSALFPKRKDVPHHQTAFTVDFSLAYPPFRRLALFDTTEQGILLIDMARADQIHQLDTIDDVEPILDGRATLKIAWARAARIENPERYTWAARVVALGRPILPEGGRGYIADVFTTAWNTTENRAALGHLFERFIDYAVAHRQDSNAEFFRSFAPAYHEAIQKIHIDEMRNSLLINALFARYEIARWLGFSWEGGRQEETRILENPYWQNLPEHIDALSRHFRNWAAGMVCAFSLMACRNIVRERVEPAFARASRRRGDSRPYTYSVLKVQPIRAARNDGEVQAGTATSIHWVRGHIKRYTPEHPLFGRLVGAFWWQPHLHGTADRFSDKQYAISGLASTPSS